MPVDTAAAFGIGAQRPTAMLRRLELFEKALMFWSHPLNRTLPSFAINALKNRKVNAYAVSTSDAFESKLKGMGIKDMCVIPDLRKLSRPSGYRRDRQPGWFRFRDYPYRDAHLSRSIQVMGFGAKYITSRPVRPISLADRQADGRGSSQWTGIGERHDGEFEHYGKLHRNYGRPTQALEDYERAH